MRGLVIAAAMIAGWPAGVMAWPSPGELCHAFLNWERMDWKEGKGPYAAIVKARIETIQDRRSEAMPERRELDVSVAIGFVVTGIERATIPVVEGSSMTLPLAPLCDSRNFDGKVLGVVAGQSVVFGISRSAADGSLVISGRT